MIKLMLILGQVRLSKGQPLPRRFRKGIRIGPCRVRAPSKVQKQGKKHSLILFSIILYPALNREVHLIGFIYNETPLIMKVTQHNDCFALHDYNRKSYYIIYILFKYFQNKVGFGLDELIEKNLITIQTKLFVFQMGISFIRLFLFDITQALLQFSNSYSSQSE